MKITITLTRQDITIIEHAIHNSTWTTVIAQNRAIDVLNKIVDAENEEHKNGTK